MKTKKIFSIILTIGICLLGMFGLELKAEEVADPKYYVTFSTDNYSKKKKNAMTLDDDHYILENVELDATTKFRVESNNGAVYFNKNNKEMSVNASTASKYNIYFSENYIYDDEHATGSLTKTDCHISYEYYLKPSYKAVVNIEDESKVEYELKFNQYNSSYDEYYLDEIKLNKNDVVTFLANNDEKVSYSSESETYSCDNSGTYKIIYTPTKTSDGNEYRFNESGSYGYGDDYKYNAYISEADLYYVVFKDKLVSKYDTVGTVTAQIEGETAYKLDYNRDNALGGYTILDFFVNQVDYNLNYLIYRLDEITNGFILINDDNDDDTVVSKIQIDDCGWYKLLFKALGNDKYSTNVDKQDRPINDYYLSANINNYLFDNYGNYVLNDDYKFSKIEEDDDLYNKDYVQYILKLTVDDFNAKNNVEFFITNGVDDYKNANDYIVLNQAGTYEIIFSNEHIYSRGRYYKYSLLKDENPKEEIVIRTDDEFKSFVDNCNNDSEYSKNKIFNLTKDINLSKYSNLRITCFNGEFNGNYHTISGLNISYDNANEYSSLFQLVTKYGVVKNVEFRNVDINSEDGSYVGVIGKLFGTAENIEVSGRISGKNYVGVIAYMGNYKLDNDDSSVDSTKNIGYSYAKNISNYSIVLGKSYVGGVVGFNGGKVVESTNDGSINNKQYPTNDNVRCVGGIAGYSIGEIISCENNGVVGYTSVGVFVGGIVGLSNGAFYFTTNNGEVFGRSNVGGVVGYYTTVSSDSDYSNYFGESNYQDIIDSFLNSSNNDDVVSSTNLNKNIILYCYNKGNVVGNSNVGGICGIVDITSSIRGCINNADISVENGSYVGGIVGNLKNGTVSECLVYGNVFASGLNMAMYVGGVVGYLDGTVSYSMSYTIIKGSNYLGGIVGYATSKASVISNISDCYFVVDSTSTSIGNVLGYAESLEQSDLSFSELIKYNYYIDNIYKGINQINYGSDSLYAASALSRDELISFNTLSKYLDNRFSNDNFIGGKLENAYPYLKLFEELIDQDDFDVTLDYNALGKKQISILFDVQQSYARKSQIYIFMEWNEDKGEVDDLDSYEINSIVRSYDNTIPGYPLFKYASGSYGRYYYQGDKNKYAVSWNDNNSTIIYAKYDVITTSISSSDNSIIVEGEFLPNTVLEVKRNGDNYVLVFKVDGKEVYYKDIVVKINKTNVGIYVCDGENKNTTDSSVYGNYTKFNLSDSNVEFGIINVDNSLPGYAYLLIGIASTIGVCAIALIITIVIKKKKAKKNTEITE